MNHKRPPPEGEYLKTTRKKREAGKLLFPRECVGTLAYQHKHCSTLPRKTQDVVARKSGSTLISALLGTVKIGQ